MPKLAEALENLVKKFKKEIPPKSEMAERMKKVAEAAKKAGEMARAEKGK